MSKNETKKELRAHLREAADYDPNAAREVVAEYLREEAEDIESLSATAAGLLNLAARTLERIHSEGK